jgi:uncharacterized protein
MGTQADATSSSPRTTLGFIDSDVHNALPSVATLRKYLPVRWHREYDDARRRAGGAGTVWSGWSYPEAGAHISAKPASGLPAGSDLELMREQLLDKWQIGYAILNPLENVQAGTGDFGLAVAAAINDWNLAEWLEEDSRLLASIAVPFEDGERAVQEVARWAEHPRFVAIERPVLSREPMGHVNYWPIYEATAAHGLPILVHVGGHHGHPITGGAGWGTYFIERHIGNTYAFQAHVVSLLKAGVFERFPGLQVVLVEGGFGWLPSLMWRLDRSWRMFPGEWPQLPCAPSDYIRQHFWFTTQPIEEPELPEYFPQLLGHLDMDDHILFASDYPHMDFDAPDQALPQGIAADLKDKIFRRNGQTLFRLT